MTHSTQDYVSTGIQARSLSLPAQVRAAGSIDAWNRRSDKAARQFEMIRAMCLATNVEEAMNEVDAVKMLG